MNSQPRRRMRRRDRGAAAVEAALVLPVILMIVFGVIDFGRMLNTQITITEAAREGARTRALGGTAAQARDRIRLIMDGTPVSVPPQDGCGANPGVNAAARVEVRTSFTFITPMGALMGAGPIQLTATGVMPCRA